MGKKLKSLSRKMNLMPSAFKWIFWSLRENQAVSTWHWGLQTLGLPEEEVQRRGAWGLGDKLCGPHLPTQTWPFTRSPCWPALLESEIREGGHAPKVPGSGVPTSDPPQIPSSPHKKCKQQVPLRVVANITTV